MLLAVQKSREAHERFGQTWTWVGETTMSLGIMCVSLRLMGIGYRFGVEKCLYETSEKLGTQSHFFRGQVIVCFLRVQIFVA